MKSASMVAPNLAVWPRTNSDQVRAQRLGETLALPVLRTEYTVDADIDMLLIVGEAGISLQRVAKAAPLPLKVDFGSGGMRHRRRGGQNELLGRAVGVGKRENLRVVDATAGLGRDSFVLADLGCTVVMAERHPVVAALLADGLDRARQAIDPWLSSVGARMTAHAGDARLLSPVTADTIYLDPMFPKRGKSAAVKADLALLQQLLVGSNGDDADALFEWAMDEAAARVVVKRPLRAQPLAGAAPSHQLRGKSIRFDVYVRRAFDTAHSV